MLAARKVLKFKAAETSEFGIAEFSVKVDLGRGGVGWDGGVLEEGDYVYP